MGSLAERHEHRYTWDDYRTWPDDERWEIVGGEAYDMSPAPTVRHQAVSGALEIRLAAWFKGRTCRVFHAPLDVKLSDEDIVQPDILVVCDARQIRPTHIEGAPTLVVEIASPRTLHHDRVTKMGLYARFGVREYWVVTPYPSLIEVYELKDGEYRLYGGYDRTDTLRSACFPDLKLALEEVFDFPPEPGDEVLTVREGRQPYAAGTPPTSR